MGSNPLVNLLSPTHYRLVACLLSLNPLLTEVFITSNFQTLTMIESYRLPTHRRGVHRKFFSISSLSRNFDYTGPNFAVRLQWVNGYLNCVKIPYNILAIPSSCLLVHLLMTVMGSLVALGQELSTLRRAMVFVVKTVIRKNYKW